MVIRIRVIHLVNAIFVMATAMAPSPSQAPLFHVVDRVGDEGADSLAVIAVLLLDGLLVCDVATFPLLLRLLQLMLRVGMLSTPVLTVLMVVFLVSALFTDVGANLLVFIT